MKSFWKKLFNLKKHKEKDSYLEAQKVYPQDLYRWSEGKELNTKELSQEDIENVINSCREKAMTKLDLKSS